MTHYQKLFQSILLITVTVAACVPSTQIVAQESEDVTISATVPAHPDDYQLAITADPRDSRQSQDANIHYTITYGSNLTYTTTPFIIQATLLPGRIQGVTVPSLYIADIVPSSASNGYMMTVPVLDLVNRTITWTMPSLPAQTKDQTISFTLKTNTSYTGSGVVDFDVAVKAITPDVTVNAVMPESYVYKQPLSQVTPTPTPSFFISNPIISSIQLTEVTNSSATITLMTDKPTTISSIATAQLDQKSIITIDHKLSQSHTLTISKLLANTSYTIIITAVDNRGRSVISDTIRIHTTLLYSPVKIDTSSLVISSLNTILSPEISTTTPIRTPLAILPINTQYTFQFRVPDASQISRIQGIIRDSSVLGFSINTLFDTASAKEPESSTEMVDMIESSPSIFTGTIKTKPTSGLYDLRVRITDIDSNITEQVLGTVSVVRPFTVLNKATNAPIEHARIFLSKYYLKTDQYIPLSPTFTNIRNPVFTDLDGESLIILPYGVYKAVVSYLGTEEIVYFKLDNSIQSGFPVVLLTPAPITMTGYIRSYAQTVLDVFVNNTLTYGTSLGSSQRLFETLSTTTLLILFLVTLLAFSSRTFIPILLIPRYLIHMIHTLRPFASSHQYISGTVIDGTTRKPIPLADVSIIDVQTNTTSTILKTDISGHYFFQVDPKQSYQIEIRMRGYERIEAVSFQPELSPYRLVHVLHAYNPRMARSAFYFIRKLLQTLLSACFEALIVASCILELLFIRYFGLSNTYPYLLASFFTIILWVAYMHHKKDPSSIRQL